MEARARTDTFQRTTADSHSQLIEYFMMGKPIEVFKSMYEMKYYFVGHPLDWSMAALPATYL